MDTGCHVLRFSQQPSVARGSGVRTTPLAGKTFGGVNLTTGVTSFPPGTGIPLHQHNCAEQVTVLEGEAEGKEMVAAMTYSNQIRHPSGALNPHRI
jgi:quercetin dioxygenase-like cupin family protein